MEHAVRKLVVADEHAVQRQALRAFVERGVVGPGATVDVEDRGVPVRLEMLQTLELAAAAVQLPLELDGLDRPVAVEGEIAGRACVVEHRRHDEKAPPARGGMR